MQMNGLHYLVGSMRPCNGEDFGVNARDKIIAVGIFSGA
jgi:hypothetical protein